MELRWHVMADPEHPLRHHRIESPVTLAFGTVQQLLDHIVDDGQELHMEADEVLGQITHFVRCRCSTSFGWVGMDAVLPGVPCILGQQMRWIAADIYVVDATILPNVYWSLTERQRLVYGLCRYTISPTLISQMTDVCASPLAPKTVSNHLGDLRRRLGVRADQLAQHAASWQPPIEGAILRRIGHPITSLLEVSRSLQ